MMIRLNYKRLLALGLALLSLVVFYLVGRPYVSRSSLSSAHPNPKHSHAINTTIPTFTAQTEELTGPVDRPLDEPTMNRTWQLKRLEDKALGTKAVYVAPGFKFSNDVYFSPPLSGPERNLSRYMINPAHVCSARGAEPGPFLMVLVLSSYLQHADKERDAIRNSYGSVAAGQAWPGGKPLAAPVSMVFLLGAPPTPDHRQAVATESAEHGDLLVADFVDTYNNLTLKVLHGLHWTAQHCPTVKFILKVDDDVFINVPFLTMFLFKSGVPNSIYGHAYFNARVERGTGRWAVKRADYSLPTFPAYVSGTAYVMSLDAARSIVKTSHALPLVPIEDAFITGVLAQISKVRRFQCKGFTRYGELQPHVCAFYNDSRFAGNNMNAVEKWVVWVALSSAEVVQVCSAQKLK